MNRRWFQSTAVCFVLVVSLLANSQTLSFAYPRNPTDQHHDSSYVAAAKRFRSLLETRQYEAARSLMADQPRRWFEERTENGSPWEIGPGEKGPWATWDQHFKKRTEPIAWEEGDQSATLAFRETNDYFQLLERGWAINSLTYFFNDAGKIKGMLIAASGKRSWGRTEEFHAWARENAADELAYLMPRGEIDPSGDRALRFHRLLNRWREAVGLSPIKE